MRTILRTLAVVAIAGCGGTSTGGGPDSSTGSGDMAGMKPGDMAGMKPADMAGMMGSGDLAMQQMGFTTVFTIILENNNYADIIGNMAGAPYINSIASKYGLATMYYDSGSHPSLPNYLYMASGDTQYPGGVDCDPTQLCDFVTQFPVDKDNLGNQLQTHGVAWRSYQESMVTPCKLSASGNYAPKHDPFLYFTDIQKGANNLCAQTNVDYGSFAADLAAGTYRYMWITPNLLDDGHNPTNDPAQGLKQADTWLSTELPKILASPTYQAGGVVFITWDEAEDGTGHIPMIVISPRGKPSYQATAKYDHASFLATVEDIFGFPRLGKAATAQTMMEFFQ